MNSDSQNPDTFSEQGVISTQASQIDYKTRLLILQQQQEKNSLATVPLLLKTLKKAELKIGLSWPNLKKILNEKVDYLKWAVIHLGTQTETEEIFQSGKEVRGFEG